MQRNVIGPVAGLIASIALVAAMPGEAVGYSALGGKCEAKTNRPAGAKHYATPLAAQHALAEAEGEEKAADAAAAARILCGVDGCTPWKAADVRDGSSIHLIVPDAAGGVHVVKDMGWLGGASACNKGEPYPKTIAPGLILVRVYEHSGSVTNSDDEYCSDDEEATSHLLLDLAENRRLVEISNAGADDGIEVKGDAVSARGCGLDLKTDLKALRLGTARFGAKAPEGPSDCDTAWPKAEKASRAQTWTCMTHYLKRAYGGTVDAEALTLDPGYGHPSEVKLGTDDLERMIRHVVQACDLGAAPVASECNRANELFTGMHRRRLGLFDDVVMDSIEPLLAKVVKGEALTEAEIYAGVEGPALSPLSLWKLRNAAYARHGYVFKTPDLNTFFYGPRDAAKDDASTVLPLKKGQPGKVDLTPTDTANVRLIKKLEQAYKGR